MMLLITQIKKQFFLRYHSHAQILPGCNSGITQFCLPPTQGPCLPLLPSRKASPPFGWYLLRLPTKEWPDWVDLGDWSHTEINFWHRELNLDMVTHPSTNRARRRLTSLIETYVLWLHQTTSIFDIIVLWLATKSSRLYESLLTSVRWNDCGAHGWVRQLHARATSAENPSLVARPMFDYRCSIICFHHCHAWRFSWSVIVMHCLCLTLIDCWPDKVMRAFSYVCCTLLYVCQRFFHQAVTELQKIGTFPDKTFAVGSQFTIFLCLRTIRKCYILSRM